MFEKVNRDIPLDGIHWFFDHAETISERSIDRVAALGGTGLYPQRNFLDRETALRMWTENTIWFSNEEVCKGRIAAGMLADLAVLDRDYFSAPGDEVRQITAVLTIVDGKPVYGAGEFAGLAPPLPPAMPDWSPVNTYGGCNKTALDTAALAKVAALVIAAQVGGSARRWPRGAQPAGKARKCCNSPPCRSSLPPQC